MLFDVSLIFLERWSLSVAGCFSIAGIVGVVVSENRGRYAEQASICSYLEMEVVEM